MAEKENIAKKIVKGTVKGVSHAFGKTGDFLKEYGKVDAHEKKRNFTDLDEAIEYASEYVSPESVERAADGQDGDSVRKGSPTRDMMANVADNRKAAAKKKTPSVKKNNVAEEQDKESDAEKKGSAADAGKIEPEKDSDRAAAIQHFKEKIEQKMDDIKCDGIQMICSGYDIRFIRTAKNDAPVQMSIRGKPVYVHPDLQDDEVFIRGSQVEISRGLADEMGRQMASDSRMHAEQTTKDGHLVTCSADLRVNGKKAVVDDSIGEYECVEVPGSRKISRELWEEAYSKIEENGGNPLWMSKTADGMTFECGYQIKVDGKPAVIDTALPKGTIRPTYEPAHISKGDWKEAVDFMRANKRSSYAKTLKDGTVVECGIEIRVNGKPAITSSELHSGTLKKATGRDQVSEVSRDDFDKAYKYMMKKGTNYYGETLTTGENAGETITYRLVMKVNGKMATIDPALRKGTATEEIKGRSVAISLEDLKEYSDIMRGEGTKSHSVTTKDGTVVNCSMVMKVNGENAEIDEGLEGITTVKREPYVKVGRGLWDQSMDELMKSPNPSRANSRIYDEKGNKVECKINLKVDGLEAAANRPFEEGTIKDGKEGFEISRDIYEKAMETMNEGKKCTHIEMLDDGREILFKRPGELRMFIPEGEINSEDMDDCIAEAAKLDASEARKALGQIYVMAWSQAKIQGTRTATNSVITAPVQYARLIGNSRTVIAQIMGTAMREMQQAYHIG